MCTWFIWHSIASISMPHLEYSAITSPCRDKRKNRHTEGSACFSFCGEKAQLLLHDHHITGTGRIQPPVRGSCKGPFSVVHYMHGVETKITIQNQVHSLLSGFTPLKLSIFQEKGPADDLPPVLLLSSSQSVLMFRCGLGILIPFLVPVPFLRGLDQFPHGLFILIDLVRMGDRACVP